jgi:uncharacterized membrane protein
MDVGKFHVLLVHFPIAMGIAAAVADLLWAITRRMPFRHAGVYCLAAALIAAPAAVTTGYLRLSELPPPPSVADVAEDHEHMGFVTLAVVVAAAASRLAWRRWLKRWLLVAYGILIAGLVVCLSVTGHLGGKISFGLDYLTGAL